MKHANLRIALLAGIVSMAMGLVACTPTVPDTLDVDGASTIPRPTAALSDQRNQLPEERIAPRKGFLLEDPEKIIFDDGVMLDPTTGQFSIGYVSIDVAKELRFSAITLGSNGSRSVRSGLLKDEGVISTRVLIDPDGRLTLDPSNLSDLPCIDQAISDQDISALFDCLGLIFESPQSGGGSGNVGSRGRGTGIGDVEPDNGLANWLSDAYPPKCEDGNPAAAKPSTAPPKPEADKPPIPAPSPGAARQAAIDAAKIKNQAAGFGDRDVEKSATDVLDAANELRTEMLRGGNPLEIIRAARRLQRSIGQLRRTIDQSPNMRRYRVNTVNFEPGGEDGNLPSESCSNLGSNPRTVWDRDILCEAFTFEECQSNFDDALSRATDGKCITTPGPDGSSFLSCRGPNDDSIGTWPPSLDRGRQCEPDESDFCWTDHNTGPKVRQGGGLSNVNVIDYIDLLDIEDILIGVCAADRC
ncbi:MAG: hypothetical protein AAF662_00580 [Pseudomonadota bacterium]